MHLGHTEQKDKEGFTGELFLVTLSEKQVLRDALKILNCFIELAS